jgi:hypothetical protein
MFLISSQPKKSDQCQLRDKKNQYFSIVSLLTLSHTKKKNVVTQSKTGLQIYEGRDDQLNRPGPMA